MRRQLWRLCDYSEIIKKHQRSKTKEWTIYAIRNDVSSYSEWNEISTAIICGCINFTTQRQTQALTTVCSSCPAQKSSNSSGAECWDNRHTSSTETLPRVYWWQSQVSQLKEVCNSWIKVSPRQDSHVCFNSTQQDFHSQWFRHWYFLKYF